MELESETNNKKNGEQLGVISAYLDSADEAREAGRTRLAVHLYCAAFELAVEQGLAPNSRVLDGMNQAWLLACEQGDHSSAETIFNDLLPYHSPEQTEEALKQLQDLAFDQLENLGFSNDAVTDFAQAIAQEIPQELPLEIAPRAPHVSVNQDGEGGKIDLTRIFNRLDINMPGLNKALETSPAQKEKEDEGFNYAALAGYTDVIRSMRQFGFVSEEDSQFSEFLAQANAFHGISGPVLSEAFYLYGPSREDVIHFAQATAGEIGWPTIEMLIETDDRNSGTIKVSGPIKRSMFGPPRVADLPRPCILIIENIDLLQDLFRAEEQSMMQGGHYSGSLGDQGSASSSQGLYGSGSMGGMPTSPQRSLQAEVFNHLNALCTYSDVFIIVTAKEAVSENPLAVGEELLDFIGSYQEIELPLPSLAEREEILQTFSREHPSFNSVDSHYLASLSQGIARNELIIAAQAAIEEAYRESIRTGQHLAVTRGSFLSHLIVFLDHESPERVKIENAIVEQFNSKIEEELLGF